MNVINYHFDTKIQACKKEDPPEYVSSKPLGSKILHRHFRRHFKIQFSRTWNGNVIVIAINAIKFPFQIEIHFNTNDSSKGYGAGVYRIQSLT